MTAARPSMAIEQLDALAPDKDGRPPRPVFVSRAARRAGPVPRAQAAGPRTQAIGVTAHTQGRAPGRVRPCGPAGWTKGCRQAVVHTRFVAARASRPRSGVGHPALPPLLRGAPRRTHVSHWRLRQLKKRSSRCCTPAGPMPLLDRLGGAGATARPRSGGTGAGQPDGRWTRPALAYALESVEVWTEPQRGDDAACTSAPNGIGEAAGVARQPVAVRDIVSRPRGRGQTRRAAGQAEAQVGWGGVGRTEVGAARAGP